MEKFSNIDAKVNDIIAEYPVKRSAAMMIMHLVQETFGWFDGDAVKYVAQKIGEEPIAVYGMLSFYPMFTEAPKGRVHIKVCRTLSCALAGSINLAGEISSLIDCPVGGSNGVYTLEFVECLGNCTHGANVQVNDRLYDRVKPENAEKFVEQIKREAEAGTLEPKSAYASAQGENFDDPAFKG
jgi:NADH:ubiquinone oxidoreductase 24 kD subunit